MDRLLRPIPLVVTAGVVALIALLVYGVASSQPDNGIDKKLASGKRVAAPALSLPELSSTSDARSFVREFHLAYPMLRDRDGSNLKSYGVVAYPETFVIGRRGRIAATRRGPVDDKFIQDAVLPLREETA